MSFKNFVCWNREQVRRVMDTEALQTPDHVFLATHNRILMFRQSLTEINTPQKYSEDQFLTDFLSTPDFAFVPVLGGAGTGKSHLIRWLATKINQVPTDKKRKVLLIPRSGTNLRDIIERILSVMEGPRAEEYRTRLANATNTLKEEEARSVLLSNLSSQIQYNASESSDDALQYVAGNLPALLLDWHFREPLLKDGAIIDRLVTHIIGNREGIEVVEERRRFTVGDLPLNVLDVQNAGATAREFYLFLIANPEVHQTTVDLLNEHLDAAIARMLQLNREDLEQLMREVRESLADDDVELILLIEDFAKLQGIDRQVLAAIIERPEELGRKRQCALRTALGCTVGYFDSLVGTVRQRTTFSVSLDVGEADLVKQEDIMSFVSRYLNAARSEETSLLNWYQESLSENAGPIEAVPNRCEICPHRDPCHSAFGQSLGFGLYPFTNKAIQRMLDRVNGGRFNPRLLIKDVLRHILENFDTSLASGEFPPPALGEHFGGTRLGANLRMQVEAVDQLNYDRREVLIDLWSDGSTLVNLDRRIHEAFDLPELANARQATSDPIPSRKATTPPKDSTDLPSRIAALIERIDAWANGLPMPQQDAQELRNLIFPAVSERIPWDAELLLRGKFIGTTGKIFRPAYVNFHNAVTYTKGAYGVELIIGREGRNLKEEAVALQGLLRHQHYGHWNYPNGALDFRTYASRLEVWSSIILEQIRRRPTASGEFWSPVPAVSELLALGVRMSGYPRPVDYSLTDLVDALFNSYDVASANPRSPAWRELFKVFCENREELTDILKTYVPCTKGGNSRLQVIDAVQIIEPLRNLRKTWIPQFKVPNDLRNDFNVIRKVREKVDQGLEVAIISEKQRHSDWLLSTASVLGEPEKRLEMIASLRMAVERAQSSGDFSAGGGSPEELKKAVDSFRNSNFDNFIGAINRAVQTNELGTVFEELSRIPQETMIKTEDFFLKTKSFLANSTARVEGRIENLRQDGGEELESAQRAIQETLERIGRTANELRGEA